MCRTISSFGVIAQWSWVVLLVAAVMSSVAAPAWAIPISPIALTGYNRDVMYGPDGGTGGGYSLGMSVSNPRSFFAAGTVDKDGATQNDGLPQGTFTSAADGTHAYWIAPAGGDTASNNVLAVDYNASRTLTLQTPGKFDTICLLGGIANPQATGSGRSVQLNYADNSSETQLVGIGPGGGDMYDVGTPATGACVFASAYEAGRTGDPALDGMVVDTGLGKHFWLYETSPISVDPAKTLQSITIWGVAERGGTWATDNCTLVFAVSGNAVPEPGALVLLLTGLFGLLRYVWRRRA